MRAKVQLTREFLREASIGHAQQRSSGGHTHRFFHRHRHRVLLFSHLAWRVPEPEINTPSSACRLRSSRRFTASFNSSTRKGFARYGSLLFSRNCMVRGASVSPVTNN